MKDCLQSRNLNSSVKYPCSSNHSSKVRLLSPSDSKKSIKKPIIKGKKKTIETLQNKLKKARFSFRKDADNKPSKKNKDVSDS